MDNINKSNDASIDTCTAQIVIDYNKLCMMKYGTEDILDVLSNKDIEDIIIMERQREHNNKISDCRNNNLDPNSPPGKGYITEVLISKFLGVDTCFELTDNFKYPRFDILECEDWGLIDVKGSALIRNSNNRLCWSFNTRKNVKPDFFFCVGYDENRKHVKGFFIIPNDEHVSKLTRITINEDGYSKWNIFKESKEEVNKLDDIFHTLKLENCNVLRNNKRLQR